MNKINPELVKCYIQKKSKTHLLDLEHKDMRFFGKMLNKISTLEEISLLEVNIFSILKKIVPAFPYGEVSLYLICVNSLHV